MAEELDFSSFIHPINGGYYGFFECPIAFLETPDTIQKLSDYIIHSAVSIDGTTALALCSEKTKSYGRDGVVDLTDITKTEKKFAKFGYGIEVWMTIAEYQVRLNSNDYTPEEI